MLISLIIQLLTWRQIPAPVIQAEKVSRLAMPTIVSELAIPAKIETEILDVAITAKSAIAVDANSGVILYKKSPDRQSSIASITKLMTALVFLESEPDLDRVVTMQQQDRHYGNIQNFNIGEQISLRNVLRATLIASDNEMAYLLARSAGMSVDEFIAAMNRKAVQLGMNKTRFVDPTGLDAENVSTPEDLVRLLSAISENELITSMTKEKKAVFSVSGLGEKPREVTVYTTDALTSASYLELLTGKTGYLPQAGYCLATKLKGQTGREIYVVVLGSENIHDRFQDVKAIEYYISKNYR